MQNIFGYDNILDVTFDVISERIFDVNGVLDILLDGTIVDDYGGTSIRCSS